MSSKSTESGAFSLDEISELEEIRKDFYVSQRPISVAENDVLLYSKSFSHLRSVDDIVDTEERCKQERIKTIQLFERFQEMSLRESVSKRMSAEMLANQFADIDLAYAETNYLRAELAEMAANKTIFTVKKKAIPMFIVASVKERYAHQAYAALALKCATSDAKEQITNDEWKRRVLCDQAMVRECERLKTDASSKKSLVLKKRRKLDLNRARAILKGDMEALQAGWPGDYSNLALGSEQLDASMSY